ncbi:MAG TPA: hypothetical protein VFH27_18395 [Longimicrobiaceae bacterium]|nr:hypothetical protein [Longimicrobiaceae bacterium]
MNAYLSRHLATRAGRRALAALLWISYGAYIAFRAMDAPEYEAPAALTLLLGLVCYGVLMRLVGIQRAECESPDERERAERDHAHFQAFRIGNWAMLLMVIYGTLAARVLGMWIPATPREAIAAVLAVAIGFGLLPATLLAWTRRDEPMDDEEAPPVALLSRTPMPRRRRMAMFAAAAVVAGVAALGWGGVVPALAPRTPVLMGIATGMMIGGVLMTRSRGGTRA